MRCISFSGKSVWGAGSASSVASMSMSMDFGQAWGFGADRKRKGRPNMWEIHEVREEANCHGSPPFTYFP